MLRAVKVHLVCFSWFKTLGDKDLETECCVLPPHRLWNREELNQGSCFSFEKLGHWVLLSVPYRAMLISFLLA